MLLFSETLVMVSDGGEHQGELTIEVQSGKYKDQQGLMSHCLIVHAGSHSVLDKTVCGNSVLGRIWASYPPFSIRSLPRVSVSSILPFDLPATG